MARQLDVENPASASNKAVLDEFVHQSNERVTLIDQTGTIIYDTEESSLHEQRKTRPEIKAILEGSTLGTSLRKSTTLNEELLYVALPIKVNGKLVAIIRIAEPTSGFLPRTEGFRRWVFGFFLVFFLLLTFMIYYLIYQRNQPLKTVIPVLKRWSRTRNKRRSLCRLLINGKNYTRRSMA